MTAADIVAYENNRIAGTLPNKTQDFVFFNSFNIYRGSKQYKLYTDDLSSIRDFR